MSLLVRRYPLTLLVLVLACAPDLGDGLEDTGEDSERIEHEELGGGVLRTTIDASDETEWVYLDLDTANEASPADAGWDLGFQRFDIIVNGGINGEAEVEVAIVEGIDFNSLTAVPDDTVWSSDAADGEDEGEDPDLVFGDWYDYDFTTHVLTPKDRVYLIRSSDGSVFKWQIADYYSMAGSSGFPKFYWAPLD
jgi:hypothetical protein